MALSYESISTASTASGNLTINKPTGLSVGDMMIAFIFVEDGTGATCAGWTSFEEAADGANRGASALWKIAVSGDVSGSSYAFAGGNEKIGAILRISGTFNGAANIVSELTFLDSADSTPNYPGITLIASGQVLLGFTAAGVTGGITTSNQAIANNNPSWTEIADFTQDSTEDQSMSVAHAVSTASGATGDFTVTFSGTPGNSYGMIMTLAESVSVSTTGTVGTLTLATTTTGTIAGSSSTTGSIGTLSLATTPVGTIGEGTAKVTNQAKSSSATVTNLAKS